MAIIFHIARRQAWTRCEALGLYHPEAFPIDGFIHCSTREQVIKVADARFRSQSGFVLLFIDTDKVAAEIRYENLEGGEEQFPHIYGELNTDAVVRVAQFEPGADGYFALPAELVLQET
jgi:uncharacterized protein (DUF952 family)